MILKKIRKKSLYLTLFILIILLIMIISKYYILKFDSTHLLNKKVLSAPPSAILVKLNDKNDTIISSVLSNTEFNLHTFMTTEEFKYADNSQLIFYVIATQNGKYVVNAIAYDVYNSNNINIKIPTDTKFLYYLFPEYKTVYAITHTDNTDISEIGMFDGREYHDSPIVGGGLSFRIYGVDVTNVVNQKFDFSIISVDESKNINSNSTIYGRYIFTIIE